MAEGPSRAPTPLTCASSPARRNLDPQPRGARAVGSQPPASVAECSSRLGVPGPAGVAMATRGPSKATGSARPFLRRLRSLSSRKGADPQAWGRMF